MERKKGKEGGAWEGRKEVGGGGGGVGEGKEGGRREQRRERREGMKERKREFNKCLSLHLPLSAMLQPFLASCRIVLSLRTRDITRGQNPLGTKGMM